MDGAIAIPAILICGNLLARMRWAHAAISKNVTNPLMYPADHVSSTPTTMTKPTLRHQATRKGGEFAPLAEGKPAGRRTGSRPAALGIC